MKNLAALVALAAVCAIGAEMSDAALLRRKADAAWARLVHHQLHPKTGILSDGIAEKGTGTLLACERYLPTPTEIAHQFPNPSGWGTTMEDGVLHTVPLLLAAIARERAIGDAESADVARRVFAGLKRCVEVPGNGYLARNISPFDLKSFYYNCSRDQYTLWIYGMWRYHGSRLATERDQADIARLATLVARYHEKHVTKENAYNSSRFDGKPAIFCRMWVEDAFRKPHLSPQDGGGSVEGLCAHEALRLHEIYLATWFFTGDHHWKELYDRIIEGGLHLAELPLRRNLPGFTSFQMQLSQRLLWELDPDPAHKDRLLKLLERGAGCAKPSFDLTERHLEMLKDDVSAPFENWRKQKFVYLNASWFATDDFIHGYAYMMPEFPGKFGTAYSAVREFAEGMCDRLLVPGAERDAALDARFDRIMARIEFKTHCSSGAVYPLLAYWWRISPEP